MFVYNDSKGQVCALRTQKVLVPLILNILACTLCLRSRLEELRLPRAGPQEHETSPKAFRDIKYLKKVFGLNISCLARKSTFKFLPILPRGYADRCLEWMSTAPVLLFFPSSCFCAFVELSAAPPFTSPWQMLIPV